MPQAAGLKIRPHREVSHESLAAIRYSGEPARLVALQGRQRECVSIRLLAERGADGGSSDCSRLGGHSRVGACGDFSTESF